MVRIPRYGQQRVQQAPLPAARVSTSFDLGLEGVEAQAQGLLRQEVKRADDTALNDALSDYDRWSLNYTNAPDGSGILEKSGDAFIAASAETEALSLVQINSISDALSPRVRDRFQAQVSSSHRRLTGSVLSRATTVRTQMFHQSVARGKETRLEAAAVMLPGAIGMEPDGTITTAPVESELRDAEEWLEGLAVANANRLGMKEADFVALHMDEFEERLIEGLINEAIADDNDELSSALHKAYGDKIAQQNRAAVKEDVDDAALIGDAKRGAASIAADVTRAPWTDAPTIGQERARALDAVDQIADDDEKRETRKAVNAFYTERERDAELDRDNARVRLEAEVEGRVAAGQPITPILNDPTFRDPNGLRSADKAALKKHAERVLTSEFEPPDTGHSGELWWLSVNDPNNPKLSDASLTRDRWSGKISSEFESDLKQMRPTATTAARTNLNGLDYKIREAAVTMADEDEQGDFYWYMKQAIQQEVAARPDQPLTPEMMDTMISRWDARVFTENPARNIFGFQIQGGVRESFELNTIPPEDRPALVRDFIAVFGVDRLDAQGLFNFSQLSAEDRAELLREAQL